MGLREKLNKSTWSKRGKVSILKMQMDRGGYRLQSPPSRQIQNLWEWRFKNLECVILTLPQAILIWPAGQWSRDWRQEDRESNCIQQGKKKLGGGGHLGFLSPTYWVDNGVSPNTEVKIHIWHYSPPLNTHTHTRWEREREPLFMFLCSWACLM